MEQYHFISVDMLKKLFHLGLLTDVGIKPVVQWSPPEEFIDSIVASIISVIQVSDFANEHENNGRYDCHAFINVCANPRCIVQ